MQYIYINNYIPELLMAYSVVVDGEFLIFWLTTGVVHKLCATGSCVQICGTA